MQEFWTHFGIHPALGALCALSLFYYLFRYQLPHITATEADRVRVIQQREFRMRLHRYCPQVAGTWKGLYSDLQAVEEFDAFSFEEHIASMWEVPQYYKGMKQVAAAAYGHGLLGIPPKGRTEIEAADWQVYQYYRHHFSTNEQAIEARKAFMTFRSYQFQRLNENGEQTTYEVKYNEHRLRQLLSYHDWKILEAKKRHIDYQRSLEDEDRKGLLYEVDRPRDTPVFTEFIKYDNPQYIEAANTSEIELEVSQNSAPIVKPISRPTLPLPEETEWELADTLELQQIEAPLPAFSEDGENTEGEADF